MSEKKLSKYLFIITFAILNIILVPICYLVSFFFSKKKSREIWQKTAGYIFKISFFVARIKVKIDNKEAIPSEVVIFAANHRSLADTFGLLTIKKKYFFMLTAPLDYFPWYLKIWIKNMGFISFFRDEHDKKNYSEGVSKETAIEETIKRLKNNESMLIYPEGHHERDNHLKKFHTGVIRFAIQSKKPIIPIAVIGTEKIITPSRYKVHSENMHIKIGKPIYYDKYYDKINDFKLVKKLTNELEIEINNLIHLRN
jgi:1-acyl-sn-glycerol-3-phosphate acyltransferase